MPYPISESGADLDEILAELSSGEGQKASESELAETIAQAVERSVRLQQEQDGPPSPTDRDRELSDFFDVSSGKDRETPAEEPEEPVTEPVWISEPNREPSPTAAEAGRDNAPKRKKKKSRKYKKAKKAGADTSAAEKSANEAPKTATPTAEPKPVKSRRESYQSAPELLDNGGGASPLPLPGFLSRLTGISDDDVEEIHPSEPEVTAVKNSTPAVEEKNPSDGPGPAGGQPNKLKAAEKHAAPRHTSDTNTGSDAKRESVKPAPNAAPAPMSFRNGSHQSRIPSGRIHTNYGDVFSQTIGDIRARQKEDLPDPQASLRSAERNYSRLASILGVIAPVRTVILALSILLLVSRGYRIPLFGFLYGETGIYTALVLTVAAMLLSWRSVIASVRDVFFLRASYETLLLIATVISGMEAASSRNIYTLLPLCTAAWCLLGSAERMRVKGKLRSLRTVITGKNRLGVRVSPERWNHMDLIGKASASTNGFVRRQEEQDTFHVAWNLFLIPLLAFCLIAGAYLTARNQTAYLYNLSQLLCVSVPVAGCLICARHYELISLSLRRSGAVAGWAGVKSLAGRKGLLIYDNDLFPQGCITHKGVKVYGDQSPRVLVSYGASLIQHADIGLKEPFKKLLSELDGQIYHVEDFQVSEGGVHGRIGNSEIAVGTYNYMQLIGAMPPRNAPKNGLYIAVDGQIAGLFAIKYRVRGGSAGSFHALWAQRRLIMVAATRNFSVNPAYMHTWFKVPVGKILCPRVNIRWKLSNPAALSRGVTCGYLTRDGIASYQALVTGARRGHFWAVLLTLGSLALSAVLVLETFLALKSGGVLPAVGTLLLYELITWILIELTARISVR